MSGFNPAFTRKMIESKGGAACGWDVKSSRSVPAFDVNELIETKLQPDGDFVLLSISTPKALISSGQAHRPRPLEAMVRYNRTGATKS